MSTSDRVMDALLVIAAQDLVEADVETARALNASEAEISRKAQRRVRRRMKRYARELQWAELPSGLRRATASVLAVCTVMLVVCMCIPDVRAGLAGTVLRWYEQFVSVFFSADEPAPEYILEYKEPLLQIAGTEKEVVTETKKLYCVVYSRENENLVSYQQITIVDEPVDMDSEDSCVQSYIEINNWAARVFSYSTGIRIITWHDNQYSYSLECFSEDIDTEMLINIAESVQ